MHRVKHYNRKVTDNLTGEIITECRAEFNQSQADFIGAVLETDGININSAKRLISMWNTWGKHKEITYHYWIDFIPNSTGE